MQLHLVYFSPTHTSRTIGRSIALGCNTDNITETDLTYRHPGQPIVIQADIAIVAVPVYGGRVAETAMERLQWIKGQQTPVIPVVVYGNRDYEDALLELTDHLKNTGFCPLAAAAFIGEHSYSRTDMPIAGGRPDAADQTAAITFGCKAVEKWNAAKQKTVFPEPHIPGNYPYKIKGPKTPAAPVTSSEKCIQCGICSEVCPTEAISGTIPVSDPTLCIKCCACVKECPAEARIFNTPYTAMLFEKCSARKEPETWF